MDNDNGVSLELSRFEPDRSGIDNDSEAIQPLLPSDELRTRKAHIARWPLVCLLMQHSSKYVNLCQVFSGVFTLMNAG
jgi:hypothetical protein